MRIAIDTGGTHTDLVLLDQLSGMLYIDKVPTTPKDLLLGIQDGMRSVMNQTKESFGRIQEFCYATTIITNMIVQKEEEKTGMLVTEGFRDILGIARAYRRWNIYDLYMDKPEPLIPRPLVLGVKERVNFSGEVIEPLQEEDLIRAIEEFTRNDIKSIAVVFFHSYRNPIHEKRAKEIIKSMKPGLLVSLSSEISPEFREYERASTTALNAFAQPRMNSHIKDLEDMLYRQRMKCRSFIMQCNGGLTSFQKIMKKPVLASSSGPVAGVLSGRFFANSVGVKNFITFDVGGTSTDISMITDNQISYTIESELEHYPIQIPMVDFLTIGAGGGSIAWIDAGQGLRVGPKSAGADPGPVCYGKGGKDPTTTDAMLLCGILHQDRFLGGKLPLLRDLAIRAFEENVCRFIDLSWEKAAVSVFRVAISNIVEGIKSVTVSKGLDPRDYTLIAFGGAGPLFACLVADELDCAAVLIPPRPGVTSALGMLTTDIRSDFVKTKICIDQNITPKEMNAYYNELYEMAIADLKGEVNSEEILLIPSIDLRYFGQSYELNVPIPTKKISAEDIIKTRKAFFKKHNKMYGHFFENKPVQYVKFRVTAAIRKKPPNAHKTVFIEFEEGDPLIEERAVLLPMGRFKIPVYDRKKMPKNFIIEGPAIIEQMDSTTLLLPGYRGKVAINRSLIIERGK